MKLNPIRAVIEGKRLVVVDDSIVRGNTTGQLVDMLHKAGAAEVHLRISSPPIRFPCFYGIDMATRDELIAARQTVDEIREHVGATSLHYLTLDGLHESTGLPRSQFCRACFDGDYPTEVPEELAMCKMRFEGGPARHPSRPGRTADRSLDHVPRAFRPEPLAALAVFGQDRPDAAPEGRTVVELAQMDEFVDHDVVGQVEGLAARVPSEG